MEIASITPQSIRIKGKQGSFVVNPNGKVSGVNGVFVMGGSSIDRSKLEEGTVIIAGPGEYELAGIKISGIRLGKETVYSINVDNVTVLLGKADILEKDHAKLKEHHIIVLDAETATNPSFVTALAPNVVIAFGEKAEDSLKLLAKEGYKKEAKYVTTLEKLPQEMEEILLA